MSDIVFGPINSFRDAERGLISHIGLWIDTFLSAVERKKGITVGTIKRPASYITKQTFTALPGEDQMPAVIVVSDGLTESPHRHGDGSWDVKMRMAVVILCHGPEGPFARDLAGYYQSALLMLVLKKPKFATVVHLDDWEGLRMEDVDDDQERTLAAVRIELVYKISDFVNDSMSVPNAPNPPNVPPTDPQSPQPDPPVVQTVQTRQEITENIQ